MRISRQVYYSAHLFARLHSSMSWDVSCCITRFDFAFHSERWRKNRALDGTPRLLFARSPSFVNQGSRRRIPELRIREVRIRVGWLQEEARAARTFHSILSTALSLPDFTNEMFFICLVRRPFHSKRERISFYIKVMNLTIILSFPCKLDTPIQAKAGHFS